LSVQRTIAALEAHRIAARTLRATADSLGLSQMDLAAISNVARSVVRRWLDDDDCTGHAPMRLLLHPQLGPELLARFAAEHGYEISKTPTDLDNTASDVLALATAAQQSSECVAAYAAAIADGSISADERDRVEREATEAIAALSALRARVRAVPATGASVRVLRAVKEGA
jgi:hypothetical protein